MDNGAGSAGRTLKVALKSHLSPNGKMLFHRLIIGISLIWLGMILGISFLEAPVKFMAPSVTREIGLDIGRYVFGVFNKVECALAIVMAILVVIIRQKGRQLILPGVVWWSLALQTFWLLPVLDERTGLILQGQTPTPSHLHTVYIVLEVLKSVALAVYGFRAFGERKKEKHPLVF
jgi:hypothetical protein